MRDLAAVLRALADETRLQMLALVFKHDEVCVNNFTEALAISQSKASRHLQYLKHARVLDDRRAGLWAFYGIAQDLGLEREALLGVMRRLLAARDLGKIEERLKRSRARRAKTAPPSGRAGRPGKKPARGFQKRA
jgi:ArsR family transcriptional regulator